jgi:hypothetical protein
MNPQFPVFLALIVGVPIAIWLWGLAGEAMGRRKWQSFATELGLELRYGNTRLSLRGWIDGVEIEVTQTVTHRYKQAPLYLATLRARWKTIEVEQRTYRAPPRRITSPGTDLVDDAKVEDDWIVLIQASELRPDKLRETLNALVARARLENESPSRERPDASSAARANLGPADPIDLEEERRLEEQFMAEVEALTAKKAEARRRKRGS